MEIASLNIQRVAVPLSGLTSHMTQGKLLIRRGGSRILSRGKYTKVLSEIKNKLKVHKVN